MPPKKRGGKPKSLNSGRRPSSKGDRYVPGNVPPKVAGYLGLTDVDSLKRVLNHPAFLAIYQEYEPKHPQLKMCKFPAVYGKILHQMQRGYGVATSDKTDWSNNDWLAHYLVAISNIKFFPLSEPPVFGPDVSRKEIRLEKWNRVRSLLSLASWTQTDTMKVRFASNDYPNAAAEVPYFMQPRLEPSADAHQPEEAATRVFPPMTFKLNWINCRSVEAHFEADDVMSAYLTNRITRQPIDMPDPRNLTGAQLRDTLRRWCNMRRLNLNIDRLTADVVGAQPDPIVFDCLAQYDQFQEYCRQDGFSVEQINVRLRTKFVTEEHEIYELVLAPGLEAYYDVNEQGTIVCKPAILETRFAEEESAEVDVTAVQQAQGAPHFQGAPANLTPQNRQLVRGQRPDDFYDSDDDLVNEEEDELLPQQKAWLTLMAGDIEGRADVLAFRPATRMELNQVKASEEVGKFFAGFPLEDEDRAAFSRSRLIQGAEKYVGPDYLHSCRLLGFLPNSQVPQIAGSRRVLKIHQVTSLAWMMANQFGKIPNFSPRNDTPQYYRLEVQGGILGNGMGTGKTAVCLAFVLMASRLPKCNISGPTLVLAPSTLILHAWIDEVREFWLDLQGFLYHGRNDGPLGQKYEDQRILAEDIGGYDGTLDTIPQRFQFLFDPTRANERATKRAIVFATYASFSSRAKEEGIDDDGEATVGSIFRNVFGIFIGDEGHALRNTQSIRYKVCSALNADSRWIVSGTPMLNRELNAYGLISFLWRDEWAQELQDAELASLTDLGTDIYENPDFTEQTLGRRFFIWPKRVKSVLSKVTSDGEVDLVHIRKYLPLIYEIALLRVQEGSRISMGNEIHVVATSLEPLQIQTVSLTPDERNVTELQTATLVYTNEFLTKVQGSGGDSKDINVTPKKARGPLSMWKYPSRWLRRLRLLASNGILADRLLKNLLSREGRTFYSQDIAEWREGGVDHRWIADKASNSIDPEMEEPEEYFKFLAAGNEKLQYLCYIINALFVGKRSKCIIAFDLPQTGIILETTLKGLRLKVAILHAQVSEADRADIQDTFSDKDDDSVQFLLISMKIASVGIDRLQNDCAFMIMYEPAINFNTMLQMIARIYRTGQENVVRVVYLFMRESVESYIWAKYREKMGGEIAEWTTGEEAETDLRLLMNQSGLAADGQIDAEALAKGCDLIVQRLFGAEEDLGRNDPHSKYYALIILPPSMMDLTSYKLKLSRLSQYLSESVSFSPGHIIYICFISSLFNNNPEDVTYCAAVLSLFCCAFPVFIPVPFIATAASSTSST